MLDVEYHRRSNEYVNLLMRILLQVPRLNYIKAREINSINNGYIVINFVHESTKLLFGHTCVALNRVDSTPFYVVL